MYSLLIVDDEISIIDGLKAMINWSHFSIDEIYIATTFTQAIDIAVQFDPNIAIVDIKINDKWGYDLVNKLTQIGLGTKFIMMSGYDDFNYVRQSLIAGAKDYLLKPLNCSEIERIIKRIIVDDLGGEIDNLPINQKKIDPILGIEYSKFSKLTNRVLVIIKSEYDNNINLISVAELFKMNSRYIGQVFLSETNMKFSEYVLAYRMMMARSLIENSNAKISYIAKRVGYTNTNYFYLHFKSYYNLSPNELRDQNKKNII